MVVIGFVIEIDGKVSEVEILKDIADGCGEDFIALKKQSKYNVGGLVNRINN